MQLFIELASLTRYEVGYVAYVDFSFNLLSFFRVFFSLFFFFSSKMLVNYFKIWTVFVSLLWITLSSLSSEDMTHPMLVKT